MPKHQYPDGKMMAAAVRRSHEGGQRPCPSRAARRSGTTALAIRGVEPRRTLGGSPDRLACEPSPSWPGDSVATFDDGLPGWRSRGAAGTDGPNETTPSDSQRVPVTGDGPRRRRELATGARVSRHHSPHRSAGARGRVSGGGPLGHVPGLRARGLAASPERAGWAAARRGGGDGLMVVMSSRPRWATARQALSGPMAQTRTADASRPQQATAGHSGLLYVCTDAHTATRLVACCRCGMDACAVGQGR